jgi:hypothetical protein
MRDNNGPTQTTEPNTDPAKRGKRKVSRRQFVHLGVVPTYAIAAEFNRRCLKERKATLEEFATRSRAARQAGDQHRALYWRRRANGVSG